MEESRLAKFLDKQEFCSFVCSCALPIMTSKKFEIQAEKLGISNTVFCHHTKDKKLWISVDRNGKIQKKAMFDNGWFTFSEGQLHGPYKVFMPESLLVIHGFFEYGVWKKWNYENRESVERISPEEFFSERL